MNSITIEKGAELQLVGPDGEIRAIRGPQRIDIYTTNLIDADSGIIIEKIKWSDFKIAPSEHSVVGLLKIINLNVNRVYNTVARLITI